MSDLNQLKKKKVDLWIIYRAVFGRKIVTR